MSVKNVDSGSKTQFNYLVCLDIIVLACILVIAGRPDGLAITLSAIIVAACAVVYRCSVGVKSYVSDTSRKAPPDLSKEERKPVPAVPAESVEEAGAGRKSWLRESG